MTDETTGRPQGPPGMPRQPAGPPPGAPPPPAPPPAAPPAKPPLPPELQTANASKDERTWGMVGHLAALAGFVIPPVGGVVGPLVVWLAKREDSRFVAFHAKQCMWLQIFALIAAVVVSIPVVTIPLGVLVYLAALVYAVYAGIRVSSGKDFEYYWVGPWVRKSMG